MTIYNFILFNISFQVFYVLYSEIHSVEMQDEITKRVQNARKRLAKMMLVIALLFTALHAPFFITFLLVALGLGVPENAFFVLVFIESLPLYNAAINPFIYSAHSRTFFKKRMVSFLGGQYAEDSIYRPSTTASKKSRAGSTLVESFRTSSNKDSSFRLSTSSGKDSSFRKDREEYINGHNVIPEEVIHLTEVVNEKPSNHLPVIYYPRDVRSSQI